MVGAIRRRLSPVPQGPRVRLTTGLEDQGVGLVGEEVGLVGEEVLRGRIEAVEEASEAEVGLMGREARGEVWAIKVEVGLGTELVEVDLETEAVEVGIKMDIMKPRHRTHLLVLAADGLVAVVEEVGSRMEARDLVNEGVLETVGAVEIGAVVTATVIAEEGVMVGIAPATAAVIETATQAVEVEVEVEVEVGMVETGVTGEGMLVMTITEGRGSSTKVMGMVAPRGVILNGEGIRGKDNDAKDGLRRTSTPSTSPLSFPSPASLEPGTPINQPRCVYLESSSLIIFFLLFVFYVFGFVSPV